MSIAALAMVLLAALAGLAYVLNHCQARLALVELVLNEGLPPGHQPADAALSARVAATADPAAVLPAGVHIFLSRNCHACQRLIDELDQVGLAVEASVHLRYVDRPRPIAVAAARRQHASLHDHQHELAVLLQADPLPFTIAVGSHDLVSRAVTPTVSQVVVAARDAGITATIAAGTGGATP